MMKKRIFTTYLMCAVLSVSFMAQAQDSLFISELIDPDDDYSGRFIELYNAGGEPVDFSTTTCFLSRQSNGGSTWGDLQLAGSVPAGGTFVIGGSAFESLYGFAPDQESGILIGNGDDAYALFTGGDHVSGVLLDIFGAVDVDGTGEAWEYTDSRALRLGHVAAPSSSWIASEWEITPANVADGDPGSHLGSSPPDTILPGSYALALVNDTVSPGQTAEVGVTVSELRPEDDIISFQFDVDFDTAALAYAGTSLVGTLAEGGTVVVNSAVAGRLSVGYMNTDPLVGAGEILKLRFTSLVPDTSLLSLSNAFLNTVPVPDLSDALVYIAETVPPSAVITYSDTVNRFADTLLITATFNEAMSASVPVRLSLGGAVSLPWEDMTRISESVYVYEFPVPKAVGEVTITLGNGTDLWGNPLVPEPESGGTFSILAFVPGDVNDDGVVQAYDAALALQYSVGIDPLPLEDPMPWDPWRDSTANVDGTGGITANDAGLILRYSAGIITAFPGESEVSTKMAYVSHALVDDHIVFYSHGKLLGLNINTSNEEGTLGTPEVLNGSFMSAINTKGNAYRIGLCTTSSVPEGEAVLRIPFSGQRSVTFHLIENARERELTVDLLTSVSGPEMENISLYPNPVKDLLHIRGLSEAVHIRICNIHAQEIYCAQVQGEVAELNLSALQPGIYLITVESAEYQLTRRLIKK